MIHPRRRASTLSSEGVETEPVLGMGHFGHINKKGEITNAASQSGGRRRSYSDSMIYQCHRFRFNKILSNHDNIALTLPPNWGHNSGLGSVKTFYSDIKDLSYVWSQNVKVSESRVKCIGTQVLSALAYMHDRSLVHADIRPENILVYSDDCSHIKLCNFTQTNKIGTFLHKTCKNTPYTPPELCQVVMKEGYHLSCKQDIWSFGVLVYFLLIKEVPWLQADEIFDPQYKKFAKWQKVAGTSAAQHTKWREFTSAAMFLFRRILKGNPKRRPTAKHIAEHIEDDETWLKRNSSSRLRRNSNSSNDIRRLRNEDSVSITSETSSEASISDDVPVREKKSRRSLRKVLYSKMASISKVLSKKPHKETELVTV